MWEFKNNREKMDLSKDMIRFVFLKDLFGFYKRNVLYVVKLEVRRIFNRLCNNISERFWWFEQGSISQYRKKWVVVLKVIQKDKLIGFSDWIQMVREMKEERLLFSL